MREDDICPRCDKPKPNVGPWDGEGGYSLLCGACKVEIAMADPARRAKFEADVRSALTQAVTR